MSSISSAEVESSTRGSSCGTNGRRTGSEPAATITWSKPTTVVDPSGVVTYTRCGETNGRSLQRRDLALLGQAGQAADEPADDAVLPRAELVEVDRRRGERQAVLAHLLGLGDDLGRVQQRLRRDAADVEADPAERVAARRRHHVRARGRRRGTPRCSHRDRRRAPAARRGGPRRRPTRRPARSRWSLGAADGVPAGGRSSGVGAGVGGRRRASSAGSPRGSASPARRGRPPRRAPRATVPAISAGTSIVALSDSRVSSGSSSATSLPAATWTSMTGTSVKSPMSGTSTTISPAMRAPRRVASARERMRYRRI